MGQELKWFDYKSNPSFSSGERPSRKVLKSQKKTFLGFWEGFCGEVCTFCPDTPTDISSAYLNQWALCDAVFCSRYRFVVPAGCRICTDWIIYWNEKVRKSAVIVLLYLAEVNMDAWVRAHFRGKKEQFVYSCVFGDSSGFDLPGTWSGGCVCVCVCALIHPHLWKYTEPA